MNIDPVNHPAHYTTGKNRIKVVSLMIKELGFCLGSAVKYVARAGKKDPAKTVGGRLGKSGLVSVNHEIARLKTHENN